MSCRFRVAGHLISHGVRLLDVNTPHFAYANDCKLQQAIFHSTRAFRKAGEANLIGFTAATLGYVHEKLFHGERGTILIFNNAINNSII